MTVLEFYEGASRVPMVSLLATDAVPRTGEFINIRGKTWLVEIVTWAVDYADSRMSERTLRANVQLKEPQPERGG